MDSSSILNETEFDFDLSDHLDENFLYLLNLVEQASGGLSNDHKELAKKWLIRLGSENAQNVTAKLKRNTFLEKLILCMQEKRLETPFNADPPTGDLPTIASEVPILSQDHPVWLDKLMQDEDNRVHVGGKHFETYLSTKLFENGRGACAYIAVSAQNETDKAGWVRIRPNEHREKEIQRLFMKELRKFEYDGYDKLEDEVFPDMESPDEYEDIKYESFPENKFPAEKDNLEDEAFPEMELSDEYEAPVPAPKKRDLSFTEEQYIAFFGA